MQRVEYGWYGGPEVMRLTAFAPPEPHGDELLVRVVAASINPFDWKRRGGELKLFFSRKFPKAMGSDFAGIVEQVGDRVTRFKPGDAVLGTTPLATSGAFGSKVITREKLIVAKPPSLSFEVAATLPIPITTAWLVLQKGKAGRGTKIFLNGAAGSVGQAFVALARAGGATIVGRVGPDDLRRADDLGLSKTIDYTKPLPASLRKDFDIVFDANGSLAPRDGEALRKPSGIVIDINPTGAKLWRALISRHRALVFFNGDVRNLEPAVAAAAANGVAPRVVETVSLDGAIDLIARLESGGIRRGKGVIAVGE